MSPSQQRAARIAPGILLALRRFPGPLWHVAEKAGYSDPCTYYALRHLIESGAAVRERGEHGGLRGPKAFVYRCAP